MASRRVKQFYLLRPLEEQLQSENWISRLGSALVIPATSSGIDSSSPSWDKGGCLICLKSILSKSLNRPCECTGIKPPVGIIRQRVMICPWHKVWSLSSRSDSNPVGAARNVSLEKSSGRHQRGVPALGLLTENSRDPTRQVTKEQLTRSLESVRFEFG